MKRNKKLKYIKKTYIVCDKEKFTVSTVYFLPHLCPIPDSKFQLSSKASWWSHLELINN